MLLKALKKIGLSVVVVGSMSIIIAFLGLVGYVTGLIVSSDISPSITVEAQSPKMFEFLYSEKVVGNRYGNVSYLHRLCNKVTDEVFYILNNDGGLTISPTERCLKNPQ